MSLIDNGDEVRAIGWVALRFANLEDSLDDILQQSVQIWPAKKGIERRCFRDKVEFLKNGFHDAFISYPGVPYADQEARRVERILTACKAVADERNNALHRPIFGGPRGQALQKARNGQMRRLYSREFIVLANRIHELDGCVMGLTLTVGKLLTAKENATNSQHSE